MLKVIVILLSISFSHADLTVEDYKRTLEQVNKKIFATLTLIGIYDAQVNKTNAELEHLQAEIKRLTPSNWVQTRAEMKRYKRSMNLANGALAGASIPLLYGAYSYFKHGSNTTRNSTDRPNFVKKTRNAGGTLILAVKFVALLMALIGICLLVSIWRE